MTRTEWQLSEADGELQIHTGVAGRAAKMGHRLALTMAAWRATVAVTDGEPSGADLTVDVGSLAVSRSEGGVKALSHHELKIIRRNALKSLGVKRFPEIGFHADGIEKLGNGDYRVAGTLEIHGKRHGRAVDFRIDDLGDCWRLSGQAEVRQTDFGIKPFSLFGGTLKVEDKVTITVDVTRPKDQSPTDIG
ncbi:YceI family protein [Smaragdicoccus niigatensis]|uniref:YceI family protein n=1 Tax=Smaragdicoccus niigatensis TaxID=359359 RepID=UPI00037D3704|nr:YceI family protein [Smaragdicoccus niigatensis]